MTLDFDDLPPLEERCNCIDGKRWISGEEQDCDRCNPDKYGKRWRPTEFGHAVLTLVVRYIGKAGNTI